MRDAAKSHYQEEFEAIKNDIQQVIQEISITPKELERFAIFTNRLDQLECRRHISKS